MRARLLRSSLLASAVAVLLIGIPLVWVGAWGLERQAHEELREHAGTIHMLVVMGRDQPLPDLRRQI